MKILVDMPVSPRTAEWLRNMGHDVVHARDIGMAKATDQEIMKKAKNDNRVILTLDLDFPQIISTTSAKSPGIILLRLEKPNVENIQKHLGSLLKIKFPQDLKNSICVVEENRFRLHRFPT